MFGVKITDYDKRVHEEEINEFVPKNCRCAYSRLSFEFKKPRKGPGYWSSRVAKDNTIEDIVQTYKDLFPNIGSASFRVM